MYILYPCEFAKLHKVDPDYELEKNMAEKYNHNIILFNFDEYILLGNPLCISEKLEKETIVIYRGWMMKPEIYEEFYNDLLKLNIRLINSPNEYNNAHCFNNSYELIKDYTPKSIFFDENEKIDFDFVKSNFQKWIMKDYVKSVKGFNFPSVFDDKMSNEELEKYVRKFIDIRDDLYTGGICLKEFVNLKWDKITHEFRAFYHNKELICLYNNSSNEDNLPTEFAMSVPKLNSNFYTIDFALLENNSLIIIETGDGQVSGIENKSIVESFYKSLKN